MTSRRSVAGSCTVHSYEAWECPLMIRSTAFGVRPEMSLIRPPRRAPGPPSSQAAPARPLTASPSWTRTTWACTPRRVSSFEYRSTAGSSSWNSTSRIMEALIAVGASLVTRPMKPIR
ncbi:hypothetical protein R1T08_07340 [Streptomyces sp. SBC-4]|nr:hypothetical protein [Streptomyces sp. SBC-4]MDV5144074.1 hypothetical protein [Streptomyces sp. SBC-4]